MSRRRINTPKHEHVLARIRNIVGEKYVRFPSAVGLPLDSVKAIMSRRLKFSGSSKKRVAQWTGLSVSSLRDDHSTKPLKTTNGSKFTRDTWLRHRGGQSFEERRQKNTPGAAGYCLAWYRILSIKIARALAVALAEDKSKDAFFKMLEAISQVGRSYSQWNNLQHWDETLQNMVGHKMAKDKKVRLISRNFEGLIAYVMKEQEKQTTSRK